MKALKLYPVLSTLALVGGMAISLMGPALAESTPGNTFHAEKLNSTIVQSNVHVASQLAIVEGKATAVFQTIVQTGVNINLNAILWNFPTDQLEETALFGDLAFLNESPLSELTQQSDWMTALGEPPVELLAAVEEPTVVEQTIIQEGMNCNISVRTITQNSGFEGFDDVDQSNTNIAEQKVLSFGELVQVEQTVQQFGFNFNQTGIFTEIPDGDDWIPTMLAGDISSLQASPLMELMNGGGGPVGPLTVQQDLQDPMHLVFQTIVQTGVNFNLNILNVISDQPAPTTPDQFLAFFPLVTQTNTNIATQVATVVPEPGSLALLAVGLSVLAARPRRRRGAAVGAAA